MRPAARTTLTALGVVALLGGAAWVRSSRAPHPASEKEERTASSSAASAGPGVGVPDLSPSAAMATPPAPATGTGSPGPTASTDSTSALSEDALMDRLRASDPGNVVRLWRAMARQFPHGRFADERDSRAVDALLALGQLREAHYRAQVFVQHYPNSPFTQHVMNLMGVHARPPGVVPEPPDEDKEL
jgi:hypothetical protein